jgi:SAM-dependent methyltransferase
MLLDSRVGMALYRLLPNHWSWRLLTREERERVFAANLTHNTIRPDYADPLRYQEGLNFDADTDRRATPRGRLVGEFLDRLKPERVLEVGPGAGFYTRLIVEHPAVREYTAVDLNPAFLDYLRPRLAQTSVNSRLIHGTIADVTTPADAVLLISTVHHIPDRLALFQHIRRCLTPAGAILAIDPPYYILQLRKVWRKCRTPGNLALRVRTQDVSTHNMCTLGEYQAIARENRVADPRRHVPQSPAEGSASSRARLPARAVLALDLTRYGDRAASQPFRSLRAWKAPVRALCSHRIRPIVSRVPLRLSRGAHERERCTAAR